MTKMRIAIVDDHAILRTGLRTIIDSQTDMETVAEAGTAAEATQCLLREKPDLITLDLELPDRDGLDLLKQLRVDLPATRVLVLTMHDDVNRFQAAAALGAVGYVVKTTPFPQLLSAIRTVHAGQTFFQVSFERPTPRSSPVKETGPSSEQPQLTQREREVIGYVAQGHTSREIAEKLFLSRKTIETYRAKIMEKLGFERRVDLVNFALRHGLATAADTSIRAPLGRIPLAPEKIG